MHELRIAATGSLQCTFQWIFAGCPSCGDMPVSLKKLLLSTRCLNPDRDRLCAASIHRCELLTPRVDIVQQLKDKVRIFVE